MPAGGVSRSLVVSTVILSVVAAAVPLIVRWSYRDWNGGLVTLALGIAVPGVACAWTAITQQFFARRKTPWFATAPLVVAVVLTAVATVAICVLGLFGALIDVLVLPVAAVALVLAWVQPRESDEFVTGLLGVALIGLAAWFAGRADEYANEALMSGAGILATLFVLWRLRRRGAT